MPLKDTNRRDFLKVGGAALAVGLSRLRRLKAAQLQAEEDLALAGLTITRIRQAVEGASDAIGIGDFEALEEAADGTGDTSVGASDDQGSHGHVVCQKDAC